ncbi:MAG TPA: tRNA-(ms[2]io[6]A)-hydroxylase [Planctomycetes bacterium]|nr:tRNA-(ms[2]io[6]A)-hydroxylase [Planctomycetota bacterium]HIK60248.1 tRNA-(ms[2]io[6]A)-hydroxylase [Planctomycetota bacterium]
MLRLDWRTPASWVEAVLSDPLALLSDHAHCELKAASAVQSLIVTYPDRQALVHELGPMAVEEMQHFNQVVAVLAGRGHTLRAARPSPYAEGLGKAARQGRKELMLDRLLVAGLIEERSFERFELLAEHSADGELKDLYSGLLVSEARHRRLFSQVARDYYPRADIETREQELRAAEAQVIRALPFEVRMHSGPVPASAAGDPSSLAEVEEPA